MAMKKALKAKWVAALRSGKFKQGEGQLRLNGKHCCLGVLCEISPAVAKRNANRWPDGETFLSEACEYAGFDTHQENELVKLNDTKKFSFKRIATWIEKNL